MNGPPKTVTANRHVIVRLTVSYWPALLIGAAWLWLFWPMMFGKAVCGFRDSAYLYYPLFEWIDTQWAVGEIPLWNPYCNYGMPVVGDGSSSVFYPGKLIFFCRFLSYPSRYGIYLAMHIPLAAAGGYWLAKTFRASKPGATLAASGYAFGGSVLFQTTNVIFLVSAAWLPAAVCCVWKMVQTRESKWAVGAGVCCALMILGGDPQMTYHVGLIAVATTLFKAWRVRIRGLRQQTSENRAWAFLLRSAFLLSVMVLVTSILAAIQIIPTYQWSRRSERTNPRQPASLFQAALDLQGASESGCLIGPPDGAIDHAYQFSKEPWSMLELFWPNFCGKPFPTNQRWTDRFPGADRIWVPSVYMGIMISMFGLIGFRLWGHRRRNVWLSWLLLIFLIASSGWYGPVWLFNELFPPTSPPMGYLPMPTVGPQVGGVYWLMQMLLPRYFVFRYPAKLFVIASLALSVLAGISLRQVRLKHCVILFAAFAVISLAQFGLVRQIINVDPSSLPNSVVSIADAFFGPYDLAGCLAEATRSTLQAVLLMGLACVSFVVVRGVLGSRSTRDSIAMAHIGLVLLTVVDVVLANGWMLATISPSAFETPTAISTKLKSLKSNQTDQSPVCLFRNRYQPRPPIEWLQTSSDQRLSEIVQWQRESLYPKHHLKHNVTLIGSFCSVWPEYYEKELNLVETSANHEWSNNTILGANLISGFPSEVSQQPAQIASVIWRADDQPNPNSVSVPARITSFSGNQVVVQLEAKTPGSLAFGRIAEPGWSATIKNPEDGKVQNLNLKVDRQQETLLLDIETAGNYQIEFRYLPTGFAIGLFTSLVGATGLVSWWIFGLWTGGQYLSG